MVFGIGVEERGVQYYLVGEGEGGCELGVANEL